MNPAFAVGDRIRFHDTPRVCGTITQFFMVEAMGRWVAHVDGDDGVKYVCLAAEMERLP